MQRALLLTVGVAQRAAVLEHLAREDEALLLRRHALLVLNLGLDVFDRVRRLDVERDFLACQRLYEDLHGGCGGEEQEEAEQAEPHRGRETLQPLVA